MNRPANLPEFAQPPLNEVVIGIQFAPPQGYAQIRAGEVWNLYRDRFPLVEEHPPLAPAFETFGLLSPPQMQFGFVSGASHDRFWFLTPGKDELIQLQQDRLIHNWRKVGDQQNPYPRFEAMASDFKNEIDQLDAYLSSLVPQKLQVNQCELSYINLIPFTDDERLPDQWLRYAHLASTGADDFNLAFRRVLYRDGEPVGRLHCEATSAVANKKQVLRFALTARGVPARPDVHAALEMHHENREIIVKAFADLTTDHAHKTWQRIQ